MQGDETDKLPGDQAVIDKQNLPYEMDAGLGRRARIGLLALSTDQSIEYELREICALPGVSFYVSRLFCDPLITPDSLRAMEKRIAPAADLLLPGFPLDVVAYGCTSGALLIGPAVVKERIREARPGVACTSPMQAAMAALKALSSRSICLITPYADEINRSLRGYLLDQGLKVPVMGSWNEPEEAKVGRISPDAIRAAVLDLGGSELVDTVFVSCTNLRALSILQAAEGDLGKPVISSNQVIGWHCLRLSGVDDRLPNLGSLFER